jgi:hypothetical protein
LEGRSRQQSLDDYYQMGTAILLKAKNKGMLQDGDFDHSLVGFQAFFITNRGKNAKQICFFFQFYL